MKRIAKKRIWELDFIRGICILLMVFDHSLLAFGYDFGPEWFPINGLFRLSASEKALKLFEVIPAIQNGSIVRLAGQNGLCRFCWFARWYWTSPERTFLHPIIFCTFIFLCGLCCSFSKSNLKRAIVLGVIAGGITGVTSMLGQENIIRFGIIHLLFVCVAVWELVHVLCKRNKVVTSFCMCALTILSIVLWYCLNNSAEFIHSINADSSFFAKILLDTKDSALFNRAIDYNTQNISSNDFFPVLPWTAVFFAGATASPWLYVDRKSRVGFLDGKWNKPVCAVGRYTLIIYITHQTIIYGILMLISYFYITPGNWVFL